jgi:predicted HicB family RNase H-like nuclease
MPSKDQVRDVAISVRTFAGVKAAAEIAAEQDGRSLSQWVERLLILHLRERGFLPAPD